MAYVIGTFQDRARVDSVINELKSMGLQDVDYAVTDRTDTVQGWFQSLFGLGDDAAKLQSKGIPPNEAEGYDDELQRGCVLLVARTDGGAPLIAEAIRASGAGDVRVYAARAGTWERVPEADLKSDRWERMYGYQEYIPPDVPSIDTPPQRAIDASSEERRIPVREEQLMTGKRTRDAGEVTVRKDVVEQPVHEDATLTRERVRIERRPVRDVITGTTAPIQGETIRVPVTDEEVVIEKRPVAKEEVVISKEREPYTQPVNETVKKEQVTVDGDRERIKADVDPERNS